LLLCAPSGLSHLAHTRMHPRHNQARKLRSYRLLETWRTVNTPSVL
jgi:hypothetical protein